MAMNVGMMACYDQAKGTMMQVLLVLSVLLLGLGLGLGRR